MTLLGDAHTSQLAPYSSTVQSALLSKMLQQAVEDKNNIKCAFHKKEPCFPRAALT